MVRVGVGAARWVEQQRLDDARHLVKLAEGPLRGEGVRPPPAARAERHVQQPARLPPCEGQSTLVLDALGSNLLAAITMRSRCLHLQRLLRRTRGARRVLPLTERVGPAALRSLGATRAVRVPHLLRVRLQVRE